MNIHMGVMDNPIAIMIGILSIVAIGVMIPTIAGLLENAQPDLPADSDWNATHNTGLPDFAENYETWMGLVVVLVIVIIAAVAIGYFRVMA